MPIKAKFDEIEVKASADVKPHLTIAADTLTAGKIHVYIQYILAE